MDDQINIVGFGGLVKSKDVLSSVAEIAWSMGFLVSGYSHFIVKPKIEEYDQISRVYQHIFQGMV